MISQAATVVSLLFAGGVAAQILLPVKEEDYTDQHVIVTGGSQGMGKAVAKQFVKRGAHVTIIARTQSTLDTALSELKAMANKNQIIRARSVDCTDSAAIVDAIKELGTPDVIFCCAGTAHPGLFAEMSAEDIAKPITGNYISSMYTAHAALKSMLRTPKDSKVTRRKIIFTSSVAAFLNLAGYSSYTPTKAAIRALADTLRLECLMYDIDVHCVFPATIYSPGFEDEQKLKPEITKILEEGDSGQTPDQVAVAALKGLDRKQAMINTELLGPVMRCNMKGPSPKNGILDLVYGTVAGIVMPFVFRDFEQKVLRYGTAKSKARV